MTGAAGQHSANSSERGFVLIAVLWILAALSVLAVVFTVYLSNSAQALAVNDTAVEAEGLIAAGVELTAYQLLLASEDSRPSRGAFHTRLNGAALDVSFVSEAARVDLNAAPKELLVGLFTTLGADGDTAAEYADRIVAWRTRPGPDAAGKEEALYRGAGLPYSPRQALFADASELALVLGLPPALVERALPLVTVYSGSSGVDALIAEPDVIAALPGMTPLILKDFMNTRESMPNDPAAISAALGTAKGAAATQKSKAYRVQIRVRLRNGRETLSEVVISIDAPNGPGGPAGQNAQAQNGPNGQNGQGGQAMQPGQSQQSAQNTQNTSGVPSGQGNQQGEQDDVPYHVLAWQDDVMPVRRVRQRE